jgi:hypothetical protein
VVRPEEEEFEESVGRTGLIVKRGEGLADEEGVVRDVWLEDDESVNVEEENVEGEERVGVGWLCWSDVSTP